MKNQKPGRVDRQLILPSNNNQVICTTTSTIGSSENQREVMGIPEPRIKKDPRMVVFRPLPTGHCSATLSVSKES